MSAFVESLRRLYLSGTIDLKKLNELLNDRKITKDEYYYIIKES